MFLTAACHLDIFIIHMIEITNRLTSTRYPLLKWQLIFSILCISCLPYITDNTLLLQDMTNDNMAPSPSFLVGVGCVHLFSFLFHRFCFSPLCAQCCCISEMSIHDCPFGCLYEDTKQVTRNGKSKDKSLCKLLCYM